MPYKAGRLTDKEARFVKVYAKTGDAVYSATKAGFSRPATDGNRTLQREGVREALAAEVERKRARNMLLALDVAHTMMADGGQWAEATRLGAVRATYADFAKTETTVDEIDPSEMSGAQLQERIALLRAEEAERAVPLIEGELAEVEDSAFE